MASIRNGQLEMTFVRSPRSFEQPLRASDVSTDADASAPIGSPAKSLALSAEQSGLEVVIGWLRADPDREQRNCEVRPLNLFAGGAIDIDRYALCRVVRE